LKGNQSSSYGRLYYREQGSELFDSYFNSVWCVIITMTTVGYGDVYAVSFFGRMISIVNALFGAFLISSLVAVIGQVFNMSEN